MTAAGLVAAALVALAWLIGSPGPVRGRLVGVAPGRPLPRAGATRLAGGTAALRALGTRIPARRHRSREATGEAVIELLESLAAELRAGRTPTAALARAGDDVADDPLRRALVPVTGAVRTGGEVPGALIVAAAEPGCAPLRWLAAGWALAESTGARLAAVVEQVAASARVEGEHRREVAAQLAAPRATARLLAGLPLVGLTIGQLLGARPVAVLIGSPAGWGCLVGGVALELVGLRWTARLARVAART